MTQNNLGTALGALGEQVDDVEQMNEVVPAYRAALEVYREVKASRYVAMVERNLEDALANLKQMQDKGPADSAA